MENIEEQLSEAKGEKISEKTFVYHGTTSENAEKILTKGIQPGFADPTKFYRGKSLANDFGFSVSRNPIESAKYGEKVIKLELSPTAKIAMPEDLPKIYYKVGDGIGFDQIKLIKVAKKAGFDGVDIGAFTELTRAHVQVKAIKEIQIFNPDVLQIVTPEEEKRE
ncbi:hypothetical protein MUP35_00985 [Patescibacteria group bacterium]|nr:hypothetical protein [Patescibacteria group bacterium]